MGLGEQGACLCEVYLVFWPVVEQRVSAPFGGWNEMMRQGGKARWGYSMGSTGGVAIEEGKIQMILCCSAHGDPENW